MAKTEESTMEEHEAPAVTGSSRQQQAAQPVQVQVNDEKAMANYANFCRVTGSPKSSLSTLVSIHNLWAYPRTRFM
ncbi:MAG: hypothetical protein R3C56_12655 [Pirellulaceae bacterium]